MYNKNIKKKIILGLFILNSFLVLILLKQNSNQNINKTNNQEIIEKNLDFKKIRGEIAEGIDRYGLEEEYSRLKKKYKDLNMQKQHNIMVFFGEIAYEKFGNRIFHLCGNEYKYGCLHGAFYSLFERKGLEAAREVDDICFKYRDAPDRGRICEYGIGRAALSFLGAEKISSALSLCSQLKRKEILFGCQDGVFIEYWLPISSLFTTTLKMKPFNAENPYHPCNVGDIVGNNYILSCYYNLPIYWTYIFKGNFKQQGEMCNFLKEDKLRKICFIGVGRSIPFSSNYETRIINQECEKMPEEDGIFACKATAYWYMVNEAKHSDKAYKICSSLSGKGKIDCNETEKLFEEFGVAL